MTRKKAKQDEKEQDTPEEKTPELTGEPKIFCFRDLLLSDENDEEQEEDDEDAKEYYQTKHHDRPPGYGITLYFITGTEERTGKPGKISAVFRIIEAIAGHLRAEKHLDVARSIEKLILKNDPIVGFIRMCISAGTGKTRCYFDARAAGLKIRKQTALALYEYTKLEQEIPITGLAPADIPPPVKFLTEIQEFFIEQLEGDEYFGQLEYVQSELSECSAGDIQSAGTEGLNPGDFIAEMGELESAKLKYFLLYRATTRRTVDRFYEGFNTPELTAILRRGK